MGGILNPKIALAAIGVALIGLCIQYVLKTIEENKFKRENGCLPGRQYPQSRWLFGLDKLVDIKTSSHEKRFLQTGMDKAKKFGHDTFHASVMGSQMTMTIDPENVKAILTSKFEDFGLGIRKKAFGPLLGEGIFVADGKQWEHSRVCIQQ